MNDGEKTEVLSNACDESLWFKYPNSTKGYNNKNKYTDSLK